MTRLGRSVAAQPYDRTWSRGTPGASLLREEILRDSPLRYWPLDELSGTTALDYSGNAGNLTHQVSPTHRASDPIPNWPTYKFSGSQWLAVSVPVSGLTQFAIEAWVLPTARDPSSPYIEQIAGSEGGTAADPTIYIRIGYGGLSANTGKPSFGAGNGSTATEAQSTVVLPLNERHHIAGRCDGTTLHLVIDGIVWATAAWSGSASFNATQFAVGTMKNNGVAAARFFRGGIGHVAIYNHDVSLDRLKAHVEAGRRMST